MKTDIAALAGTLTPCGEITTTLGRRFIVGTIHPDDREAGQWWVEPRGADEYDWWIPLAKIVAVNGTAMATPAGG